MYVCMVVCLSIYQSMKLYPLIRMCIYLRFLLTYGPPAHVPLPPPPTNAITPRPRMHNVPAIADLTTGCFASRKLRTASPSLHFFVDFPSPNVRCVVSWRAIRGLVATWKSFLVRVGWSGVRLASVGLSWPWVELSLDSVELLLG